MKTPSRPAGRKKNAERETPWHDEWMKNVLRPALETPGARRELAEFLAGDRGEATVLSFQNKFTKVARRESFFNGDEVLAIQAWLKSKK